MINLDEILLNEKTIFKDNRLLIGVFGSGLTLRNFAQKPYFKVYDSESVTKSSKVVRIYFDEPEYVYSEHREPGKGVWYLNSYERKYLDNILSDPDNWGKLIMGLNEITRLNVWYSKPDYTKLERRN